MLVLVSAGDGESAAERVTGQMAGSYSTEQSPYDAVEHKSEETGKANSQHALDDIRR